MSVIQKSIRAAKLLRRFAALQRSQWWDAEQLQKYQFARLTQALQSARHNTRFYSRLYKEHQVNLAAIQSTADLCRLPLITKQKLLAAPLPDRLKYGASSGKLIQRNTSGSTGEAFSVLLSCYEKDSRVLVELRMLRAHGLGPRHRMLALRRMSDVDKQPNPVTYLGLYPRHFISLLADTDNKLAELERICPHVMKAHPSSLLPMAQLLLKNDKKPPGSLQCIISCAEHLDIPARQYIEHAFGVPVIDQYGTVEFGFLAWECPQHNGLHVNAEDFLVEIVDEDGKAVPPGETGQVVVTSFSQETMPLVRYCTGDRALWIQDPCACGRGLPRIRLVRGRTIDFVYRADGTEVNPHFFSVVWEGIAGIVQFQVIQEALDSITYRYVADAGSDFTAIESALRNRILAEFGSSTRLTFDRVSEIAPEVSGKLKYVHSRIKSAATDATS